MSRLLVNVKRDDHHRDALRRDAPEDGARREKSSVGSRLWREVGTCVVRVWVSGRERHKLRTRMLSATVTVLYARHDSDLLDSTIR